MKVRNEPLQFYIDKINRKEYFSQGMYGDGEWLGIFHERVGGMNAESTIYERSLCDALEESLRFQDPNFFFSSPKDLDRPEVFGPVRIDKWLQAHGLDIEFYEKDMWDKAMKDGTLRDFIDILYGHHIVYVSNKALRKLDFIDHFIEIPYPNCWEHRERIKEELLAHNQPGIYLFSCGLPAAVFVQDVHGKIPESFLLDVGSIFDTFVGIGAQRGFRSELYSNPIKYEAWKRQYPRWPINSQLPSSN